MATGNVIWIGSDQPIHLENLTDDLGAIVDDATVTGRLLDSSGTEVTTFSLSISDVNTGLYRGEIPDSVTSTLTDCSRYKTELTASISSDVKRVFTDEWIAIDDGCNVLIRYDSPHLEKLNVADGELGTLILTIKAATTAIEKHCGRSFSQASVDEVLATGQLGWTRLKRLPVVTVDQIFSDSAEVLGIKNRTATHASFNVTSTGMTLSHTTGGTTTTNTLLWADNATLSALSTAIDALGNGWTTTVRNDYGTYPTTDIKAHQWSNVSTSFVEVRSWIQTNDHVEFDLGQGMLKGFSPYSSIRVKYTGGFSVIPEDIQKVCANLVANMFDEKSGTLKSEKLGDYSYSISEASTDKLPIRDKQILNQYRLWRV